jgi:hypothetical protein
MNRISVVHLAPKWRPMFWPGSQALAALGLEADAALHASGDTTDVDVRYRILGVRCVGTAARAVLLNSGPRQRNVLKSGRQLTR